jgi:MFS family permease
MANSHLNPFKIRNVRLFTLFRVLFNARFYYPVFSILFLDFGLSLSQFALLNAVWAATIVLCEVPSGALADTIGRRNLLVFAGVLMVTEVSLWAFVPRANLNLLFWVFVVNRILSGMAEAAASGADEALAYDSLQQEGDLNDWGRVLERQIQIQSVGFVFAMTLGGVVYDPQLLQWGTDLLGLDFVISRATTLRLPIYLTLITAIGVLLTTLSMRETSAAAKAADSAQQGEAVGESFKLIWQAGRWIFRTPFVLGIILFGLLYDSVIRMLITMASEYYRVISIPESLFGILGSAVALFGFVVPGIARRLSNKYSPLFNLLFTAGLILLGLVGMAQAWPTLGVFPALLLFSNMFMVNFFLSHYLNRATRSDQRATVLSFKGLFLNLGYGAIGIFYAVLLAFLRERIQPGSLVESETALKDSIFIASLPWFSWYFLALLVLLLIGFTRALWKEP